ncbi:ABC transporter permease [Bosea sp. (in: a-proteobacteria)]|jgi:NitT/TauT family transport system permease protein|uniref:ABC transporter permease n=1 Tax=Bosea sp. (in: a-proteobacteria) TaxID=1871050 RepID=UPI003F7106F4
MRRGATIIFWRLAILGVALAIWQWGYSLRGIEALRAFVPDILDPYFVSKPSEVWQSFLRLSCLANADGVYHGFDRAAIGACFGLDPNNLLAATGVTLRNTFWGFSGGALLGVAAGLLLGRSDFLTSIFGPYIAALNSVPRIALVPLIILMFGLGDMSKVVTAWIVVFFVVFFNTFEGTRAVDRDQIAASRLLGASELTVLRTVVIPSAMAWVFASLTPAVSFALVGVIVAEFIGAERGIGKLIIEAQARANASEMMVAILVLMVVGMLLSVVVRRVQGYLLRWQPQFSEAVT